MTPRILLAMALALLAAGCEFIAPVRSGGGTEGVGLTGTLLMPDGSPAAGVRIQAYPPDAAPAALARAGKHPALPPVALDSAVTDAKGRFGLSRLGAGVYNVTASTTRGDTTLGALFAEVDYEGGRRDLGADTVRATGSVTLQVWIHDTLFVGATCFVPGTPFLGVTDDQGVCVLTTLPPADYRVVVEHPEHGAASTDVLAVIPGEALICDALFLSPEPEPAEP